METTTATAFIIAVIALILYYFKRKEIASVQQEFLFREASFKKELESVQARLLSSLQEILSRETSFKRELGDAQAKLNNSYQAILLLARQQF